MRIRELIDEVAERQVAHDPHVDLGPNAGWCRHRLRSQRPRNLAAERRLQMVGYMRLTGTVFLPIDV
jgi:hypothetical protein